MNLKRIFIISLGFILLALLSMLRPMNYDEPYYIESARMLFSGFIPYTEFHFHMMPLLIIIYSPFSSLGIWSYIILKLVSVLFVFLTFLIYYRYLKANSFEKTEMVMFAILFFSNTFFLDWSLTVKNYSVSAFIFAGFVICFGKFINSLQSSKYLYLSALFAMLLIMLKHSFAGNIAVFLGFGYYVFRKSASKVNIKKFLWSLLIPAFPLLLFLILFAGNFDRLYFELVESNIIMQGHNHPFAISKVFLAFLVPQNFILIFIIAFSGLKYSLFEKFILLNILIFILVHVFTSIIPEYYSTFIPLLIFLAVLRFRGFIENFRNWFPSITSIKYAVLVLYLIVMPFGISSLKYVFEKRPLVVNTFEMFEIRKIINDIKGKSILSSWEGYSIYSTKVPLMTGDYISSFLRDYMPEEKMKKYNVSAYNDFRSIIQNRIPDIVVYDTVNPAHLKDMQELIESSYFKVSEYKFIIFYKKI